jgi:hypothetical protein
MKAHDARNFYLTGIAIGMIQPEDSGLFQAAHFCGLVSLPPISFDKSMPHVPG